MPMLNGPVYEHTQYSRGIRWILAVLFAACFAGFLLAGTVGDIKILGLMAMLTGWMLLMLSQMQVMVDRQKVQVKFSTGWPSRTIPLRHIAAVRPVKNRWLAGWGVRYIGRGWMFNIDGLDAVELSLKNGRRFRIGTDDPQGLTEAIQSLMDPDQSRQSAII